MPRDADDRSAGDVAIAILGGLAHLVESTEPAALHDEPDGVHQHRTSVRRLRSVLAAFRPLFDRASIERLRLHWGEWGSELGVVRDIEVRADVAEETLADVDADAGVIRRLVDDERAAYVSAQARLVVLAGSARATQRRDELHAFLTDPPCTEAAARQAPKRMRKILRDEARRVEASASKAGTNLERLHALRKAGRRLRYSAETLSSEPTDVLGEPGRDLAGAGERIHDVLGDHRDLLIFAEHAERAAARARHAGEGTDAYAALIERAQHRAEDVFAELSGALDEFRSAAVTFDS